MFPYLCGYREVHQRVFPACFPGCPGSWHPQFLLGGLLFGRRSGLSLDTPLSSVTPDPWSGPLGSQLLQGGVGLTGDRGGWGQWGLNASI